jgi:TolB-like protein/Flp pilus assembly protein TadD
VKKPIRDERAAARNDKCFHSWKEISAYFNCSVITAQRWEKLESLPVHRHFHNRLGSAYAFQSEIDHWLERRASGTPASSIPGPPSEAASRKPMLAVLPFENLTGNPDQEYFCDGLTAETITEIGRLYADRMGVIARTSVMRYKLARKGIKRIAGELGANYVLEGSVRQTESRVRVAVQLINASDQTQIWAQAHEVPLGDILTIQSGIAQAVAEKVGIKFYLPPVARRQVLSPEAIENYFKGRFHWYKLSRENFDIAFQYFQLAASKDPTFALAYAGIADVWLIRGDNGIIPAREAYPKAKAALSKALEVDDSLTDIHVTQGNIKFAYEWDWSGAEAEFLQAIRLNPNSAHARFMYSDFLMCMQRFEQAWAEMDRVLQLDPLNAFFQCFLGWHLLYLKRNDDAVAHLRKTLKAELDLPAAHMALWGALHRKGRYKDALAEAREFYLILGDNEIAEALKVHSDVPVSYARAMQTAADKLAARSAYRFVPSIRIARLYAHASDDSNALHWLEKAYENHEPPLVHLSVGWDWDHLRANRRFQCILADMKFPAQTASG